MAKRKKKPRRPPSHYRRTPIPGLMLYPTVLLLNLVVHTAEDHAATDGLIPAATVDQVTALIRHEYDLADLDRAQGRGVVISCISQFFHPDDYLSVRTRPWCRPRACAG